ncbi:MAG: hypothetical protein QOF30_1113 [Acidimicrobiaceae bacterium]|jgi:predicted dithiol-disulfide oxidoreductase (DUF899 family)|nr:hypothetical protein [Acidimicrobiaceae bacterium]
MDLTRLNESGDYRRHREQLRVAELDLIDHVERVAALRRQLPADTVVPDYELVDVTSRDHIRLSQLFSAPQRDLIVYHFMYGKAQTEPCPLCTMWIDGYNAAAPHVTQNVDFVVVAAAAPDALQAHAASRGWSNLRLLSAGESMFKYDLGSEEADGTQTEWISVFTFGDDGTVRHLYSKGAQMADDRRERGIDLLSPVWHLLDLTPNGRGDWYPALSY